MKNYYRVMLGKKCPAKALSYNGIVESWPEITRLAREGDKPRTTPANMFKGNEK